MNANNFAVNFKMTAIAFQALQKSKIYRVVCGSLYLIL